MSDWYYFLFPYFLLQWSIPTQFFKFLIFKYSIIHGKHGFCAWVKDYMFYFLFKLYCLCIVNKIVDAQRIIQLSLNMVVFKSGDWPKKWCPKFCHVQNPPQCRLYMKKSTKLYWYTYNNAVPLLHIVKTLIFYLVYNFKFSTILSAGQPACQLAVRWDSASAMVPDFLHKMVITSSLWICYFKEGSSTAPWSFFYLSLLSFLFYSLIKRWETHKRGVDWL